MKKTVFIFGLCFLAASLSAETSPQLDSIRFAAYNQIGVPSGGTTRVTDAIANVIINHGIQKVTTDFPAVEKLDTITIKGDEEGGALASDFVAIDWCQLMIGDTLRIPLEYKPEDSLFLKRPTQDDSKGQVDDVTDPRYYYTKAGRLMAFPKVIASSDITSGDSALFLIGYYAVGDPLSSGTDSTNIDEEYRDELLNWVCYRLEKLRYRWISADTYKADYDAEVKRAGFKK